MGNVLINPLREVCEIPCRPLKAPAAHVLQDARMFRLNSGSHDAIKKYTYYNKYEEMKLQQ